MWSSSQIRLVLYLCVDEAASGLDVVVVVMDTGIFAYQFLPNNK